MQIALVLLLLICFRHSTAAAEVTVRAEREKAGARMAEFAERYQSESKQRQLDELTRHHAQQAEQFKELWHYVLLGGSLIVIGGGAFFMWRLRCSHRLLAEANSQLQRAGNDLQAILEAIPDLLFEMDLDGRFLACHSLHNELLIAPLKTLLGKTVAEVMSPDAVGICLAALREAQEKEVSSGKQIELTLPYGKFWFELSVARKRVKPGEEDRYVVLSRDITERKRAEDVLKFIAQGHGAIGGEAFLSALARYIGERLGVDYVIIDKLAADPAYAETVAIYAKGKVIPNMQYSLQHTPCDNVMFGSLCCYPADVQRQFPKDRLLVDMQVESYAGIPLWDTTGEVIGLIAVMDGKPMGDANSVTSVLQLVATSAAAELNRRQMEEQLRKSEREFRTLAENSPDIVVRYDHEGRFVYANPTFQRRLGHTMEQLRGKRPTELPGLLEAKFVEPRVLEVAHTGIVDEFERCIHTLDGNAFWGQVLIVPEFDQSGRVAHVQVLTRDISALKAAERHLAESREQLRALAMQWDSEQGAARKRLAYDVHEGMGQNLMALRMNLQLLGEGVSREGAALSERVGGMLGVVDNTIKLVREVTLALHPRVLDMGLVTALEWLADTFGKQHGITCEFTLLGEEMPMSERLATVLFRVAEEALSHIKRHGDAKQVSVELEPANDICRLIVREQRKAVDVATQPDVRNFFGLAWTQEQIIAMGGEFVMFFAPEHGIVIEASVPKQAG